MRKKNFAEHYVDDLIQFIKNPKMEPALPFRWINIAKVIGFSLIVDFVLMFIALIILGSLIGPELEEEHKMTQLLKQDTSPLFFFLFAVIIAPLFEETIFRLWLRFRSLSLFIALAVCALIMIAGATGWVFWLVIVFFIAILFYLLVIYQNPEKAREKLYSFWANRFPWLFYASVLAFGLVHLSNFTLPWYQLLLYAPILTLPQILLGALLGYLRIRYGFAFAVLHHATHNAILMIPVLLFMS